MFSADIDFHRELRKGDTFTRDLRSADRRRRADHLGQRPAGRVLAAEFVNGGKAHHGAVVRRRRPARAPTSASTARASGAPSWPARWRSRASPRASRCACTRSCSTWRAHLGVDYGAPTGTPVRSVGDGVVEFAGWQNGYGNVVQIKHSNERTHALCAPEPHRRAARASASSRASASAPSAPPAGPPGRTCTSSSGQRPAAESAGDGQGLRGADHRPPRRRSAALRADRARSRKSQLDGWPTTSAMAAQLAQRRVACAAARRRPQSRDA